MIGCQNGIADTMTTLKLIQIGDSVGIILPAEVLARLKLKMGDMVYLTDLANGLTLSPYSSEFEAEMAAAGQIMKERRDVLRELAK